MSPAILIEPTDVIMASAREVRRNPQSTTVLSVVAPCLNEQDNIDPLVDRTLATFNQMGIVGQLVLVDDGSTDATWERIERRGRSDPRVVARRHTVNQGMVPAWRTGLAAAAGELVCLIDSDLQNRPEDIARLHEAYAAGSYDVIQAVRRSVHSARRLHLFSRGLCRLLNLTFGMKLRDNKSGFVLCRRKVLAAILRHRYRYRYFQSFLGVSAGARGFTIGEVDTVFDRRQHGKSFLSRFPLVFSTRVVWELLKFRLETLTFAPAPASSALSTQHSALDVEAWNDAFAREHDIDDYYERSGFLIRWIERRRLAHIRRLASASPGDRILEVGCGGGHVLRLFPESDLTGVDVSGHMLDKARRNLQGYRVRLLKGELRELDLPDGSFDRIICTEVLEHVTDPGAILRDIRRLLKPRGIAVITFPNDALVNRIKRLVRATGLTALPPFRRVSWGGDEYHLHVWSIGQMRELLARHFRITAERFAPFRLFAIRCCFQCRPE